MESEAARTGTHETIRSDPEAGTSVINVQQLAIRADLLAPVLLGPHTNCHQVFLPRNLSIAMVIAVPKTGTLTTLSLDVDSRRRTSIFLGLEHELLEDDWRIICRMTTSIRNGQLEKSKVEVRFIYIR
jgi:hypothetical protein